MTNSLLFRLLFHYGPLLFRYVPLSALIGHGVPGELLTLIKYAKKTYFAIFFKFWQIVDR